MTDTRTAELLHRLNVASTQPVAQNGRVDAALRVIAVVVAGLAAPGAIVGFMMGDALALTTSAGLIAFAFMARDVGNWRQEGLTPMTLFAFAGVLRAIANTFAVLNQDTASRPKYFLYAIDQHLSLAMQIEWIGLVMPILGFYLLFRTPSGRTLCALLPPVRGSIAPRTLLPLAVAAGGLGIAANVTQALPSLGTLNSLIYFFPHLAAFTLAYVGVRRKWPRAVWLGLAVAVAESGRALLFAYLRSDVISPILAYSVGVVLGRRSLQVLRSIYVTPVYAAAALFILFFAAFAEVRENTGGGLERLEAVALSRAEQVEVEMSQRHGLLTRLTSINQLTQIGRIVEEDGYLGGETLEYLAYAWIPRLLWPEKPAIAKGAWFALRIGQARIADGRITNSVNMTVPGELYLNFGWVGLAVGGLLFGGFFAMLWYAAGQLHGDTNVLGNAFAYYLLWIGLGGGADLQVIVTLVATYVLFVAVGIGFSSGNVPSRPSASIASVPTAATPPTR